ncbi:MAG: hypothetical protein ACK4PR_02700 [Gammaproteobacteria bacterium]
MSSEKITHITIMEIDLLFFLKKLATQFISHAIQTEIAGIPIIPAIRYPISYGRDKLKLPKLYSNTVTNNDITNIAKMVLLILLIFTLLIKLLAFILACLGFDLLGFSGIKQKNAFY